MVIKIIYINLITQRKHIVNYQRMCACGQGHKGNATGTRHN